MIGTIAEVHAQHTLAHVCLQDCAHNYEAAGLSLLSKVSSFNVSSALPGTPVPQFVGVLVLCLQYCALPVGLVMCNV